MSMSQISHIGKSEKREFPHLRIVFGILYERLNPDDEVREDFIETK